MKYVNKVTLIGNLACDPEQKDHSDKPLVTFVVATNRVWKNQLGEKQSLAEYHNIAAWGGLAEHSQKILKKGKLVYIEGHLKTRQWEDGGNRHFRTEIVMESLIVLDKKPLDYEDEM